MKSDRKIFRMLLKGSREKMSHEKRVLIFLQLFFCVRVTQYSIALIPKLTVRRGNSHINLYFLAGRCNF